MGAGNRGKPDPMSYLSRFRVDEPPFKKKQEDAYVWLAEEYARRDSEKTAEDYLRLIRKVGAKPEQIHSRGHYLPEFRALDAAREIFPAPGPADVGARMAFFERAASGIFDRLFRDPPGFDDLYHVTCTGYAAPSPAQKWAVTSGLHQRVRVHHLYHMGCYASLPALRLARGATALGRTVEICHTEFCTLHLQPVRPTLEEIVIQTLFADGACAYRMSPAPPRQGPSLRFVGAHEEILPESEDLMAWGLAPWGMRMSLSKEVPRCLKKGLGGVLERGFAEGLDLRDPGILWAVHPGGPRIVEEVADLLGLADAQIRHSLSVLRARGNLSSATLPHIWKEILDDETVPAGTRIVTLAFGPGLTVSAARLEVVR